MKLVVTGGAGFIGSNFVRYILEKYPAYRIVNLDKLTYSGRLENLEGVRRNPRHTFVRVDICNRKKMQEIFSRSVDAVVHFAAESHVDRSILDGAPFIRTNVGGTNCLLETAKRAGVKRFVLVSTDEVYGAAPQGRKFTEDAPLVPSTPYAASKAGAELIARAFRQTYQFPAIVTRCSNNFGPYQFPEKFIPLSISRASRDLSIPIYGDGMHIRDWIYVTDHCVALDLILHDGRDGETYNIGAGQECSNIEISRLILRKMGKASSLLTFVEDRPGHDRRYAMDPSKLRGELGWAPRTGLEEGIEKTIEWYLAHRKWERQVLGRRFRSYFRRQYELRSETLSETLRTDSVSRKRASR